MNPFEAISYINNYRNKFETKNAKKHTRSIFLTKDYFFKLRDFFKDPAMKAYDGIRIFFACYNTLLVPSQIHKKQITIILAPTKNKRADFDILNIRFKDALNHGELCPNACDATTASGTSQTGTNNPVPDPFMSLTPAEAYKYIRNYRKRFCKIGNKKHSKSLWMPKKNFLFLGDFFSADNPRANEFSGIRIFFACYNKFIPETDNARTKQITLIFTAADNKKEPQFDALNNFYLIYKQAFRAEEFRNENHGELCPNACDEDGF